MASFNFLAAQKAVEHLDNGGNNPWDVNDASAFLFYCCPECDFQCQKMVEFAGHSLGMHIRSKARSALQSSGKT